jgi:tetratricopeptide (TPR) repeat protein
MRFAEIVQNPAFTFITGLLGGTLAVPLKAWFEAWTGESRRRGELKTSFVKQVEALSPTYDLMSNHAYLLSSRLLHFVRDRRALQMQLIDGANRDAYRSTLERNLDDTAASALFAAGKLYRLVTDRFWIEGGDYLVPDVWARRALIGLHNDIMRLLRFDSTVLLKHIGRDVDEAAFRLALAAAQDGGTGGDLKLAYAAYRDWLDKQDGEVKRLAVTARAYAKLFESQLQRLYDAERGRADADPMQAAEVTGSARGLPAGTRDMIKLASAQLQQDEAAELALAQEIQNPQRSRSNALLSAARWQTLAGLPALAVASCQSAVDADPENADAHNGLANALASAGRLDEAQTHHRQAAELDGAEPLFDMNRARMLAGAGRHEAALPAFAAAVGKAAAPGQAGELLATLRNDIGLSLLALGRFDEAIQSFRDAVAQSPREPVFHANMASAWERHGDAMNGAAQPAALRTAALAYQSAAGVELAPHAAAQWLHAARLHKRLELWPEALDCCTRALAPETPAAERMRAHTLAGEIHEAQADQARAARAFASALRVSPPEPACINAALSGLARCGAVTSDLGALALACCRDAVNADPTNRVRRGELAGVYFALGDLAGFLEERDAILRLLLEAPAPDAKELAQCYNQLGLACRKNGVMDLALQHYRKAIQLNPTPAYQRNLGLFLQSRGDHDAALAALAAAVPQGAAPDHDVCLGMADALLHRKADTDTLAAADCAQALRLCEQARQLRPEGSDARVCTARCLQRLGRLDDAARAWRSAAAVQGDGAARQASLQQALAACELALAAAPEHAALQQLRAEVLARMQPGDTAERAFLDAQALPALAPGSAPGSAGNSAAEHYRLARSAYGDGQFASALAHFQEARRLPHPADLAATLLRRMGDSCFRLGWHAQAERRWQEALEHDRANAQARHNLEVLAARRAGRTAADPDVDIDDH